MKLSMAAWAGFFAIATAAPAHAISIQDFFNDAVISTKIRRAALVLSLSTEEFRNAEAGIIPIIACIEEAFMHDKHDPRGEDPTGYVGLVDRMLDAKNKSAYVEDYIVKSIKIFCQSYSGQKFVPVKVPTTAVTFFYELLPDNADKVIVLNLALSTQGARAHLAGDEARAQCIDGLLVRTVDNHLVIPFPDAFKQDIMKKLAVAYASASATDSVESILMDAITKNCGHESE